MSKNMRARVLLGVMAAGVLALNAQVGYAAEVVKEIDSYQAKPVYAVNDGEIRKEINDRDAVAKDGTIKFKGSAGVADSDYNKPGQKNSVKPSAGVGAIATGTFNATATHGKALSENTYVYNVSGGFARTLDGKATASDNYAEIVTPHAEASSVMMGGTALAMGKGDVEASRNTALLRGEAHYSEPAYPVAGGWAYTAAGSAVVSENKLTVTATKGTAESMNVRGGFARVNSGAGTITMNKNIATVTGLGGTLGTIEGARAESKDGAITMDGNEVKLVSFAKASTDKAKTTWLHAAYGESVKGAVTVTNNKAEVQGVVLGKLNGAAKAVSQEGAVVANNNTLILGTEEAPVFTQEGAFAGLAGTNKADATANGNKLVYGDGFLRGDVAAGLANSTEGNATANDNIFEYNDGTTITAFGGKATVYGGKGLATASGNKMMITHCDGNQEGVHAGIAFNDGEGDVLVENNVLSVEHATLSVGGEAGHGKSKTGKVTVRNNTTTYGEGTKASGFGGYANTDSGVAEVYHNTMNYHGEHGEIGVYGAYASIATGGTANIHDNVLNFSGGNMIGKAGIFGAQGNVSDTTKNGLVHVTKNTANVTGGVLHGTIGGGEASGYGVGMGSHGDGAATAIANENVLRVTGGNFHKITNVFGGRAQNKLETATANRNVATFKRESGEAPEIADYGESMKVGLYGGVASSWTKDVTANENQLTVGSYFFGADRIVGGMATSFQGAAGKDAAEGNAMANNNVVKVADGNKAWEAAGGYARAQKGNAIATGNKIDFVKGGAKNLLAGGYAQTEDGDAQALHNEVTVGADATVLKSVYAGYAESKNGNSTATDNTLTLKKGAHVAAAGLMGANETAKVRKNNTLVLDGWEGKALMAGNFNAVAFDNLALTQDKTVMTLEHGDFNAANITLRSGVRIGDKTKIGDIYHLIQATDKLGGINTSKATVALNNLVDANGVVKNSADGKAIDFVVKRLGENRLGAGVLESRGLSIGLMDHAADVAATSLRALSDDYRYGWEVFADVDFSRNEFKLSDEKVNGTSAIVGMGNSRDTADSRLAYGFFMEYGNGRYSLLSHNDKVEYYGLGAAARYTLKDGMYYEGSLRGGQMENKLGGVKAKNNYLGAHLGVGKVIAYGEQDLDIYAKYFYGNYGDENIVYADTPVHFDSVDSNRFRVGARLKTNHDAAMNFYYGLAYEYQTNGEAKTRLGDFAAERSLKGSSFIAEAGLTYRPGVDSPLGLDLQVQGLTGERKGFGANVQVTYRF